MSDNTNNYITEYILIRAEDKRGKFRKVSYSLPITLSYLGIFSSLICEFMVIMSALSRSNHEINFTVMAGGAIVFVLCTVAAVAFSLLEKRSIQKADEERKEILKGITPVDGTVKNVNKYIRRIHHDGNAYEESVYTFSIEYSDSETGELKTLESEKYLNDVTQVLSDNKVNIYFEKNGDFELDGFVFRKSESDPPYPLEVNDIVTGEETIYAFDSVTLGTKKDKKNDKTKN